MRPLHILVLEPYYGGSHRAFLDALRARSRHRYTLLTLAARKWKWRMRGAAVWFARRLAQAPPPPVDLLLTTDMLSVADLRALLSGELARVPILCYCHENQLTYPLPDERDRDYQYGFTNITSCLAADQVWFNSAFHRDGFLGAARDLLRRMPDHVPAGVIADIQARSSVVYPIVDTEACLQARREAERPNGPLRILWNHRWEYDKNPESFFDVMTRLADGGASFRLVILGEVFREAPAVFAESMKRLAPLVEEAGYVESVSEYRRRMAGCDVVVSTAIQENFGIATVEAITCGCRPLLPDRLSYPELLPPEFHARCLYRDEDELLCRLTALASGAIASMDDDLMHTERARAVTKRFGGPDRGREIDDMLAAAAAQRARAP